jgi:hypothetical protein
VAVEHSILVIAYHILKVGTTYGDLGNDYSDKRDSAWLQRRLIARLEAFGRRITLERPPKLLETHPSDSFSWQPLMPFGWNQAKTAPRVKYEAAGRACQVENEYFILVVGR